MSNNIIKLIRLATENPEVRRDVLPYVYQKSAAFRRVVGKAFSSKEQLEKYLHDHPKAKPQNHWVSGDTDESGAKKKQKPFKETRFKVLLGIEDLQDTLNTVKQFQSGKDVSKSELEKAHKKIKNFIADEQAYEYNFGSSPKELKDLKVVQKSIERKLKAPKEYEFLDKTKKKGPVPAKEWYAKDKK